eukprot:Skav231315  [mRNA]  locus=scaffold1116:56711:58060:- [translate_table: standard]
MILYGWLVVALTAADRTLEEGLLEFESSFLQISVENATLINKVQHINEVSEPWISLGTVHFSIYLVAFLLVPICALACAGPKWLLAAMITCADSTCTELPMAIFPMIAEGPLALGALVATKPLGQALATPLVMRFTRHRELHAMKLGLLLQSAGLLLQGFTPSLGAWFAARSAQGVASALVLSPAMAAGREALAVVNVKEGTYVDPIILVYSMYFGVIVGAPFGGVGFSIQPFLPFLFLALAELVLMVAVHARLDAPSPMPGPPPMLLPLQHPMISRPVVLFCFLIMYISALQAMVFKVIEDEFHLSVAAASFAWLFNTSLAVLTALLLGPTAQFIGFRLIMLSGILLAGSSALLADQASLVVIVVQLLAAGVAVGAENATVPRLLEDVFLRHFDDAYGVYVLLNLGQQLGYVLGPLAGALLCQVSSFQTMCRSFGILLLGYALAHTTE